MASVLSKLDTFIEKIKFDDSGIPYFQVVIGFMIVEYVWHAYLDLRQRKVIRTEDPPDDLKDHYTADHVEKTRSYSLDKKNFSMIKQFYGFLEALVTLWYRILPLMWSFSKASVDRLNPAWAKSEVVVSIAFVLITAVLSTIKELPWGLYYTFVIEERHGFNKQTIGLFFTDLVKSLMLTFVLAPPITAAVTYIMMVSGPYVALYLWAFLFVLQLVIMTLYPTLIAPLFNKYDPLPEGSLRDGIEKLAGALSFPLKKLYVMDGSKRSGHSNAYMYGFFKNKRIVLYDTLIKQCNEEQVVAVLAHELGHWKLSHTICLMVFGQVVMLAQFSAFTLIRNSAHLFESFGFHDERPVIMAFMLFMTVMAPVDQILHYIQNLISRRFEFQADGFAVSMNNGPRLVEALKILDKENKSDFVVDPLYSAYHYSHPPMVERIRAIEKKMAAGLKKMM